MKYEELSNEIIEAVGGKQNIVSLQHCMTHKRSSIINKKGRTISNCNWDICP